MWYFKLLLSFLAGKIIWGKLLLSSFWLTLWLYLLNNIIRLFIFFLQWFRILNGQFYPLFMQFYRLFMQYIFLMFLFVDTSIQLSLLFLSLRYLLNSWSFRLYSEIIKLNSINTIDNRQLINDYILYMTLIIFLIDT